jgi:hypothetical protein
MNDWQCSKCKKYISVDLNKIKIGESVSFKLYEDGLYVKYEAGIVLNVDKKNFFIRSNYGLHRVVKNNVYPLNAPISFVYNMFGVCSCED